MLRLPDTIEQTDADLTDMKACLDRAKRDQDPGAIQVIKAAIDVLLTHRYRLMFPRLFGRG